MKAKTRLTMPLLYCFSILLISCHSNNVQLQEPASADRYSQSTSYAESGAAEKATDAAVNSYAKEISDDGQRHFLQSIKNDILDSDFAAANKKFYYVNKHFPPKGTSGVSVYSIEQQSLYDEIAIDLKVYTIMNDKHEQNPPLQLVNAGSGTTTHLTINNETAYPLSLYFSGAHSIAINLTPGESRIIYLHAGHYNSSASVSHSSKVTNFAGAQNFKGGKYQITYTMNAASS